MTLESKFIGCLLGLAVGDALGSHFEGQATDWIARRYPSIQSLIDHPPEAPWHYTDDTQMAIGVAEALLKDRAIIEKTLCDAFVENFVPNRGYGRGARRILMAMEEGQDFKHLANELFPGGSFGNGAAMRVASVGLLFHDDAKMVKEQARLSSLPTHVHPLGIEGAQLIALAVANCVNMPTFDRAEFFDTLTSHAMTPDFREKLSRARTATSVKSLLELGNGIAAQDSVVTAIGCFANFPDSYEQVIASAILLGGDTDTIAAMAGAISGAYLGEAAIPQRFIESLEDDHKGRSYIVELAKRLHECS